ncbi:MAG: hypothetical protein WAK48_29410 [Candidatus Acidiferrum sp.]|jgi:hypothetical protein
MKFWNMLGTASRYVLAAVSCISLAQFLLLLSVGTENAGRLAGQALGRGVITGFVAAVLFYRARKIRPPAPANVQTQVQVAPPPKLPAVPPMDSVPSTSPASVLTPHHSGSSFEQKELKSVIIVVAVGIGVILFMLTPTEMFHQSWALSAGASQPRFIHVQGAPSWQMFDNRTGQTCVTNPVAYDSVEKVREEFREAWLNNARNTKGFWAHFCEDEKCVESAVDSLDSSDPDKRYSGYQQFYKRYDALKANPDNPPVYHYDGMPYCKEL